MISDRLSRFLFFFIKKSAMTVTFEIRIGYLRAELFAHTFVLGAFAYSARTVTAFCDKTFANGLYHFFILVESYSHRINFLMASPTAPCTLVLSVT